MRATLHHLNKLASRSQHEDREVSYAMRLLQRGNTVSNGLDDEEKHSIPPEEFERCKNMAWDLNISEGAGTLAALNCCWAFLRLFEILQDWITRKEVDVRFKFNWRLIEVLFLLGVLFPLMRTMKDPRTLVYFPIVALYFIYVVLIGLPPLTFSCQELAANLQKFNSTHREDLNERLHHSDCGMQGETLVQVMMAWLMLTPRVMPTMTMMRFTWLWIAAYFGCAFAWDWIEKTLEKDGTKVSENRQAKQFRDLLLIVILLCCVNLFAVGRKYYLEKGQQTKFIYDWQQREATQQIFRILEYMVPVHVIVPMLKNPGSVIADEVKCASILFVMFSDFDQTARRKQPAELLDYLNSYFTQFDKICAKHEVTKIETVGEEYVCAVGVVPKDWEVNAALGHAVILHRLIKAATEILQVQRDSDEEVKLKMGIHTGPVVAGVIGQKLPRFRLFGDTINTAARIMQKGLPGELQFGKATKDHLPPGVKCRFRDNIEMKGKGKVPTWLLGAEEAPPSANEPNEPNAKPPEPKSAKKRVSFAEPRDSTSSRGSRPSITDALRSVDTQLPATPDADQAWNVAQQLSEKSAARRNHRRPSREMEPTTQVIEMTETRRSSRSSILRRSTSQGSSFGRRSLLDEENPDAVRRSSRTSEVWIDPTNFDDILRKVTADDESPDDSVTVPSLLARLRRCLSPGRQGFTEELEDKFHRWFHDNTTMKKLDTRLDRQALVVSVLTTVDMAYSVFVTRVFEDDSFGRFSAKIRLPVFLCSRLAVLFLILAWRTAYASKHAMLSYKKAYYGLLVSYCAIATLMVCSYDALTKSPEKSPELDHNGAFKEQETSIHSLLIMPMFQLTITQNPFLFRSSLLFVVLAIAIMTLESCGWLFWNLFMTHQSRVVFIGVSVIHAYVSHSAETTFRQRFKAQNDVEFTRERTESILNTLMPVMVVEELRDFSISEAFPSHHYRNATIAQSDLCGFTRLASTRSPEEVVKFIGELFGLFDELTDKHEVYKVETVGDAYIAGQAEAPLTFKNSPLCVVRFGLEMVQKTNKWSRDRKEQVSCRVGVHSGECIGGIVGTEMQRYHLFGKLMTEVEVLESTAPEGRVQVSRACKDAVDKQMRLEGMSESLAMFEERSEETLRTSKGEEHSYDEVGGRTFVVRSYVY